MSASATTRNLLQARLRRAHGFTLVELMVTVAIALFLIGGLLTILQNVRGAYNNQQALSQLQDQQRFAMTVLTDVIQAGGYFPDPVAWGPATALPAAGVYTAGQAFTGTHARGAPDSIGVRYRTAISDGVILCDGSTNTALAPTGLYTNTFTLALPVGNNPGQLLCQLNDNPAVPLVSGVQGLVVYYGVKRDFTFIDYNVDTYLLADQMDPADWSNISSVRIILTFTNPMANQPGQPATIDFERVVAVMGRAGVHT